MGLKDLLRWVAPRYMALSAFVVASVLAIAAAKTVGDRLGDVIEYLTGISPLMGVIVGTPLFLLVLGMAWVIVYQVEETYIEWGGVLQDSWYWWISAHRLRDWLLEDENS